MKSNKLIDFINLYKNNENFVFWKIKTRVDKILEYFLLKLFKIQPDKRTNKIILLTKDDKSKLMNGSSNVNANSDYRDLYFSKSTVRQYIQVLEGFGVITEIAENEYLISDYYYSLDASKQIDINTAYDYIFNLNRSLGKNSVSILYSLIYSYIFIKQADSKNIDREYFLQAKKNLNKYKYNQIKDYIEECGYDSVYEYLDNNYYDSSYKDFDQIKLYFNII